MISSTIGGASAGYLALAAINVTADQTAKMIRLIADTLDAPSLLFLGDLIVYTERESPHTGDLLTQSRTETILKPIYGKEKTRAFMSLLDEGYLHNSTFELDEGRVRLGKYVPALFTYDPPGNPGNNAPPSQHASNPERPARSTRRPRPATKESAATTTMAAVRRTGRVSPKDIGPMADLYGPTEEVIASLAPRIVPITNPNIPLKELRSIPKKYFDRAVFLALGAPRRKDGKEMSIIDGQELWLMGGSRFEKKGRIEGCLLVSRRCPRSRKGREYPRVRLRFHDGRWIVKNQSIRGRHASDMVHAVLTNTDWNLMHDGNAFPQAHEFRLSQKELERRTEILDMTYRIRSLEG